MDVFDRTVVRAGQHTREGRGVQTKGDIWTGSLSPETPTYVIGLVRDGSVRGLGRGTSLSSGLSCQLLGLGYLWTTPTPRQQDYCLSDIHGLEAHHVGC